MPLFSSLKVQKKTENKKNTDMTTSEMRAKIAYLEAENEFLKKLKDPEPQN